MGGRNGWLDYWAGWPGWGCRSGSREAIDRAGRCGDEMRSGVGLGREG